jgi:hypothetical protein
MPQLLLLFALSNVEMGAGEYGDVYASAAEKIIVRLREHAEDNFSLLAEYMFRVPYKGSGR